MSRKRIGEKIKLESIEDILNVPCSEGKQDIDISLIRPFNEHPYQVRDDERMDELKESIANQGVLTPVIVRPVDGGYEMLSGHRRLHAAESIGLGKIPAVVVYVDDDEATIIMVDSNLQREELLPSERAFSLKMKMDALRHQGTCRHDVDKLSPLERKTATIVGEGSGLTGRSVQRYIKLTTLLPELLQMVDDKKLSLVNGVEIASFDKEIQGWLLKYIKEHGRIRTEQVAALKEHNNPGNLTQYTVLNLLRKALENAPKSKKVVLSELKLTRYFPEEYSASKREKIIMDLLKKWKEEQENSQEAH